MDVSAIVCAKVMDGDGLLAQFIDKDKFFRYLADGPKFTEVRVIFKDGTEQKFDVAAVARAIKFYFPDGITNTIEGGGHKPRP